MCKNCSDPLVKLAQELKYNLVKIPRSRIHPLDVLLLCPDSELKRYCSLPKMIFPNINPNGGRIVPSPPEFVEDIASNFSGQFSSKVGFEIGLSFLENVLRMLGADTANLGLKMGSAKHLQFQFKNVKCESVELRNLSRFMLKTVPDISVDYPLMNEKGEAFVITDVLRSNSIDVKAFDQSGHELDLDIDAISEVVGPHVSTSRKVADELQVSFEGEVDLTFAFKAAVFWIEKPTWSRYPLFKLDPRSSSGPGIILYAVAPNIEAKEELTEVVFPDSFVGIGELELQEAPLSSVAR